jgi:hypothetical protein
MEHLEKPPMTANDIIIQASDRDDANSFWEVLGCGPETFSNGLVPADGPASATPPTNYIASGAFEASFPGSLFNFAAAFPTASQKTFTGAPPTIPGKRALWLTSLNLQRQQAPI